MNGLKLWAALGFCLCASSAAAHVEDVMNEPDSVYLFSYATVSDDGRSGLKFAWSPDGNKWFGIGNGYVKCDYGAWGAEKRMLKPELRCDENGVWHCIWQLNGNGKEFAHAASEDLMKWKRQSYFTDKQFATYVPEEWIQYPAQSVLIDGVQEHGTVQKIAWNEVNRLIQFADYRAYKAQLHDERTEQDAQRFAGLNTVNMTLTACPDSAKSISDKLIGIFFEDINYGADGGLYAELIQNRDFEYSLNDRQEWNSTYAWTLKGEGTRMAVETAEPLHANNPHYVVLDTKTPGASLINSGFDGIVVRKGEKYDFSVFARTPGKSGKIRVSLQDGKGNELASEVVTVASRNWKKQTAVLIPQADADDAVLVLSPQKQGKYVLDMISLFPQHTFKGRKNGLRADLAQTLADLHPRFVRFPGGCVAHGNGIDNIYRWKNSIGPLETRKPMRNLWGYHQTMGLGYYEYFQFCEDIGAEPLPVLAAGVPCQNSACIPGKLLSGGQQGGIPMEEMDEYVQDILDLIAYANGDPKQNKWAKMRAEAGHPKPFNLKYIGIGNEDLITDVFEERFTMIYKAIKAQHPEITVIGTVGPFYEGTDYEEGWELATRLNVPMVDEHYYNTPGWFINNQDYYDRYDRSKSKVYLGEYAAHLPGRPNNIETALAEALYLTAVERNGDVVSMTSYAPLLAKEGHTQWNPDLIYFNNKEVKPTVGYYTQQLFGQNSGDTYIPTERKVDNTRMDVQKRIASSVIRDSRTGDLIVKLVNLLPVSVKTAVEFPGLTNSSAVLHVLSGKPSDQHVRPQESTINVSEKFDYEMPAYSLSVVRIPSQLKNNR
ncbi:alpha-L-arabinofuranosidase C-terminal domain-containing protein [uncultured Phocaeicola sp.]|uniref:alpha-L-arabinofuranosidase C-terminal domain-containing protein n=1 Tax=uncultured Phocaeicola sp. TaxID=990718 RepID=UPI002593305C|nr:alpha-L-arabinofuranosidase C-terminal domain-containing protein [uncultured Phocaeicola sp.]